MAVKAAGRFHATATAVSWHVMHAAVCPTCKLHRPWRKRTDATKAFAGSGIPVEIDECACDELCRCPKEAA